MSEVRRRNKAGGGKPPAPTPKGTTAAGVSPVQGSASGEKARHVDGENAAVIIDSEQRASNYVYFRRKCRSSYRKVRRVPFEAWLSIACVFAISTLCAFLVGVRVAMNMVSTKGVCFIGGETRPFSEHDGTYDSVARAQMVYEVDECHPAPDSEFQDIEVFSNSFFGKVLVVDEEIMITERDETRYHEMIAHVPLAYLSGEHQMKRILSQTGRKGLRVLIIGGGDGGTLLQVLKHSNVEKVTMVELDPAVVNASKTYFPKLARAFQDERCNLIFADGAKFVSERLGMEYVDLINGNKIAIRIANARGLKKALPENQFELIIVDSTDFGVAMPLFTRQWYMQLQELLVPNFGILTFNVDSPSWAINTVSHVTRLMSTVFKQSFLYQVFMPTYISGHYSFMFASDSVHPYKSDVNWGSMEAKNLGTSYYNKEVHMASFALPNFVKDVVLTDVQK